MKLKNMFKTQVYVQSQVYVKSCLLNHCYEYMALHTCILNIFLMITVMNKVKFMLKVVC